MSATLATIDAALYAALTPLQCPSGGIVADARPFAYVGRWVGEIAEEQIREVCAQFPACLLRFDQETSDRVISTVGGSAEDRATSSWTVMVAVEDPREITDAMVGSAGVPGALTLIGLVNTTINALLTTDAWHWRRLRYADTRPMLIKRGALYVYGARYESMRVAEDTTPTDTSVDLADIYGTIADYGSSDELGSEPIYPADVFAEDLS